MPSRRARLRRILRSQQQNENSEDPFEKEQQVHLRETTIRNREREDEDSNDTEMTNNRWPRHRRRRDTPATHVRILEHHPAFRFDTGLSCGGYMTRDTAVREMMDHRKRHSALFSDNEDGRKSRNTQRDLYGTLKPFKGNSANKADGQQSRSCDILTGSDLYLRPGDEESMEDVVQSDSLEVHGGLFPVDSGELSSDFPYYEEKEKEKEQTRGVEKELSTSTDWKRMLNIENDEIRKRKNDTLKDMLRYFEDERMIARRNVCFADFSNGLAYARERSRTDKGKRVSRLRNERIAVKTFKTDSRVTEAETTSDLLSEFKNNRYSPSFQNPNMECKRRDACFTPVDSGSDTILFSNDYETLRTTSGLRVADGVGSEIIGDDGGLSPGNHAVHINANLDQNGTNTESAHPADFKDGTQSMDNDEIKSENGNQEEYCENNADTNNGQNLTDGEHKLADRGEHLKPNIHVQSKIDTWQKGWVSSSDAKKGQHFQVQIYNHLKLDQVAARVDSWRSDWEPGALRQRTHVVNLDSNKEFLRSLKHVRSKINSGNNTLEDNVEKQWSRYMPQQDKPKAGHASGRKSGSAKTPKAPNEKDVNDVSAPERECRPVSSHGLGTAPVQRRN